MAGDDDQNWSSMSFRVHADIEMTKLDRSIIPTDDAIRGVCVFKDPNINQRLIDEADEAGRDGRLPHATLDRLRTEPQSLGRLRGSLLDTRQAKLAAKELASRLEARAEMRRTQNKYDKLHTRASAAERLPKDEEVKRLEELRHEKAYCDVSRDSRAIEFDDAMQRLKHEPHYIPDPSDRDDPSSR